MVAWGNAPGNNQEQWPRAEGPAHSMPQSLDHILLHIVFSTKDRFPFLVPSIRPALQAYLAAVVRNAGCGCPRIGAVSDHVHLAVQLTRTITVASLVEQVKTSSSKWLKAHSSDLGDFAWQRGYGVFSVGPSDLDALLLYIDNQQEHHRTRSYQDEYREFLKTYGLACGERYVWD